MPISIDEFKKAFAGKPAGDDLTGRRDKVEKSLKLLNAAVKQSEQEQRAVDGYDSVLKRLVQRYAAVSTKSADAGANAATELDEILRQSEVAISGINAAAIKNDLASSTTGPIAQAAPPLAAPPPPTPTAPTRTTPPPTTTPPPKPPPVAPTTSRTMRTGVALVPDYKGLRMRMTDWVAKNISRDRARAIVNLSNLREVHTDGNIVNAVGAEILAKVKVGPGGTELETFELDPSFAPTPSWDVSEGNVAVEIEVIDGAAGLPIKGAIVRLSDGKPYATDGDGVAKIELPANFTTKADVSATGYVSASLDIYTINQKVERAVRLVPVASSTMDLSEVTITVFDITEGTPVPGATVKVGNFTKTADDDGTVLLDLVPGEYPFTITATDFVTETGKIDVRAGKKVVINESIGIKPVGSEDIYVRVLSSRTKKPIADAIVRIASQQENTNNNGEARFLNMAFGEYRLGAQAAGHKSHAETIKHNQQSGTKFREIKLEPGKP